MSAPRVDGVIDARGIDANGITLARLTANARLINGSGQVRAAFAGRRGAAFAFSTLADVSPDQIRLTGSGRHPAPAAGAQSGRGPDPVGRRVGAGADQF